MIEKTNSFKTSDGQIHGTIEAAQQHAIASIIPATERSEDRFSIAHAIIENKEKVLAILKLKARKPKAAKPKTPKAATPKKAQAEREVAGLDRR